VIKRRYTTVQNQLPPEENEHPYYEPLSVSHLPPEPEKPPKLPKQKMILVAGKLMIACAGFALFSVLYFVTDLWNWVNSYHLDEFFELAIVILVFSEEIGVVYALMLLPLGIFGVVCANKPEKAPTFILLGLVSISLQFFVRILAFSTTSYSGFGGLTEFFYGIFFGIPICSIPPILYIRGGKQLKKAALAVADNLEN